MIWQDADSGAQLGFTMFYQEPSWLQDSAACAAQPARQPQRAADRRQPPIGARPQRRQPRVHRPRLPARRRVLLAGRRRRRGSRRPATSSSRCAASSEETIRFYDLRGDAPVVSPCYLGEPVGGSAADPTWAPDGSAVAWAEGDGIWIDARRRARLHRLLLGEAAPDHPRRLAARLGPRPTRRREAARARQARRAGRQRRGRSSSRRPRASSAARLLRRGLKITVTATQTGTAAATLRTGRRWSPAARGRSPRGRARADAEAVAAAGAARAPRPRARAAGEDRHARPRPEDHAPALTTQKISTGRAPGRAHGRRGPH